MLVAVGHHRVLSGQRVFINDPALLEIPGFAKSAKEKLQSRRLAVQLSLKNPATSEELSIIATTALFGSDPENENSPAAFRVGSTPLRIMATSTENSDGCASHAAHHELPGAVLVVNRGEFHHDQHLNILNVFQEHVPSWRNSNVQKRRARPES
jgi:hypothetical protein